MINPAAFPTVTKIPQIILRTFLSSHFTLHHSYPRSPNGELAST